MKYKDAVKYITNPLPESITLEQLGGKIQVRGLYLCEKDIRDQEKVLIKAITNPVFTAENIHILKKKSSSVILKIYEIIMYKSGLHKNSENYGNILLLENDTDLCNYLRMSEEMKKPIWGGYTSISEMYHLEYLMMILYRNNKGMGGKK